MFMQLYSIVSQAWKVNIKTLLNTICLLFAFFVATNNVSAEITIEAGSLLDLVRGSTNSNSEPLRPGDWKTFRATAFRGNLRDIDLVPVVQLASGEQLMSSIKKDPKIGYIEFSATGGAKQKWYASPKEHCQSYETQLTHSIEYKWDTSSGIRPYTVIAKVFDEKGHLRDSVSWEVQVGELTYEPLQDLPLNPSIPDPPTVEIWPETSENATSLPRVGENMIFDVRATSYDGIASIAFLLEDSHGFRQPIDKKESFQPSKRNLIYWPSFKVEYTWETQGEYRMIAEIRTKEGGFREVKWNIEVRAPNQAPTQINEEDYYSLDALVVGSDPGIVDVSEHFIDPEGNRLEFDKVSVNPHTPNIVTLRVLEDRNGFKSIIEIEPKNPGIAIFYAIVRERDGLPAMQRFTVALTENQTPIPIELTADGGPATVDVSAYFNALNRDRLTYAAWTNAPSVVKLKREGSLLTITPKVAGSATVTVRATDPDGLRTRQHLSVFVSDAEIPIIDVLVEDTPIVPPENMEETYGPIEDATIVRSPTPPADQYVPVPGNVIVSPTASPDLMILDVPEVSKAVLTTGERFQMETRVWNRGKAASSATKLRYYLSVDETISPEADTEVASSRVDALSGRGASASRRRFDLLETLIAPDTPGTHYYGVYIDSVAGESNTSNNCSQAIEITVEAPPPDPSETLEPDLFISGTRVAESTIRLGGGVRLYFTVENRGRSAAPATTLRYYRSLDATISPEADTELRAVPIGRIGPGKRETTWGLLPSPVSLGVFYYGVCVDSVASELDTSNNCSEAFEITVVAQGTGKSELSPLGTISTQKLNVGDSPIVLDVSSKFFGKVESYTASSSDTSVVTAVMADSEVTLTLVSEGRAIVTIVASRGDLAAQQTFSVSVGNPSTPEPTVPTTPGPDTSVTPDPIIPPPTDTLTELSMPDANLRAAVKSALGLAEGDTLTQQKMLRLTTLIAYRSGITDLTGLEHATGLTELKLLENNISDISVLSGLTNLVRLNLPASGLSDISALSGLTNLETLVFFGELPSDISVLSGLTNLVRLDLQSGDLSAISILSGLTNLTALDLRYNSISDISALSGLTNLTRLTLYGNSISDISALSGLTNLKTLGLSQNSISDISVLSGLTNLTNLDLDFNSISDISVLSGLTSLTFLGLTHNSISNVAPLEGLTSLQTLYIGANSIEDWEPICRLKENNPTMYINPSLGSLCNGAPSASVFPDETALLSNYPNPFNPETWIPYQLAVAADVTLTIYDVRGGVVRRLALGHRYAGFYRSRGRAAYWDGRNDIGEKVATGLYFYTFTAGDFSATKKMLIRK